MAENTKNKLLLGVTWPSRRWILKEITLHWWKCMNCGHWRCMHLNGKTFQCVCSRELAYVNFPVHGSSISVSILERTCSFPLHATEFQLPLPYITEGLASKAMQKLRKSSTNENKVFQQLLPFTACITFSLILLTFTFILLLGKFMMVHKSGK